MTDINCKEPNIETKTTIDVIKYFFRNIFKKNEEKKNILNKNKDYNTITK